MVHDRFTICFPYNASPSELIYHQIVSWQLAINFCWCKSINATDDICVDHCSAPLPEPSWQRPGLWGGGLRGFCPGWGPHWGGWWKAAWGPGRPSCPAAQCCPAWYAKQCHQHQSEWLATPASHLQACKQLHYKVCLVTRNPLVLSSSMLLCLVRQAMSSTLVRMADNTSFTPAGV